MLCLETVSVSEREERRGRGQSVKGRDGTLGIKQVKVYEMEEKEEVNGVKVGNI